MDSTHSCVQVEWMDSTLSCILNTKEGVMKLRAHSDNSLEKLKELKEKLEELHECTGQVINHIQIDIIKNEQETTTTAQSYNTMLKTTNNTVKCENLTDEVGKISGTALQALYNQFMKSFKTKRFPQYIYGVQLNSYHNVIYVYCDIGHECVGLKFSKTDKYLQTCSNVKVIGKPAPNPLSCSNCNRVECASLTGDLDKYSKSWVGLGSTILAIPKTTWTQIPQLDTASFQSIHDVTAFIGGKTVPGPFCEKWSLGSNMVTQSNTQVIITSYHSLDNCEARTELVFLTEISTPTKTQVKVLSDVYVHKDPNVARASNVGYCDPNDGTDILVLELHEDVIDLLQGKIMDVCNTDDVSYILRLITKVPELGATVAKRGAVTGITYGKVIANHVLLNAVGNHDGTVETFAVGSTIPPTGSAIEFARPGDSGSLVFQKEGRDEKAILKLGAHGLVWNSDWIVNDFTEELDEKATTCSKLSNNFKALEDGHYDNLTFPRPPTAQVYGYDAACGPLVEIEGLENATD